MSTPFPYTTLFRSQARANLGAHRLEPTVVDGPRKWPALGEIHHAQPEAHGGGQDSVVGQDVLRASSSDVEGDGGPGGGAEAGHDTAEGEACLLLSAHDLDSAAGGPGDGCREVATICRLTHGAGGHDPYHGRLRLKASFDVALHHRSRAVHRPVAQGPTDGHALTQPRDLLILIDDGPGRPGAYLDGEEANRVATEIDGGESHADTNAPPSASAGRSAAFRELLLLEGADVVDDLPALLLREMLPRRHGSSPVRDLPEDLAVGLFLDLVRGPVGRLGRQRGRGRAIALVAGPVARDAVLVDHLLGFA